MFFQHTRDAINETIADFRRWFYIFKYSSLVVTVAYLIYAIAVGLGYLWANVLLLAVVSSYFLFDIITVGGIDRESRRVRRQVRRVYAWVRLIIKAITLTVTLYSIYIATTAVSPISIILTTLMIILFVLQLLFELVCIVIENKKERFLNALHEDLEGFRKVGETVKGAAETVAKPVETAVKGIGKIKDFFTRHRDETNQK